MIRDFTRSAILAALLAAAGAAAAAPITLHAYPEGQLLSDVRVAGYFDAGTQIPAGASIRSAAFIFDFEDDADAYADQYKETGSSITDYVQGDTRPVRGGAIATFFTRDERHSYDVQRGYDQESARVSIGGAQASGATAATQSVATETEQVSTSFDTPGEPGYINRYVTNLFQDLTITTTDWTGAFSVAGQITDPGALRSLLASGSLPFMLDVSGDLTLTSARLVLEFAEPGGQDLPEPSSAALLLLGGAGLALRRRRGR